MALLIESANTEVEQMKRKKRKAAATFRSLADAWVDTTTPHGRLILTALGGIAEFEGELIRARTGEGRARAKTRGVHKGRPRKLTPHQRQEALKRREAGESLTDITRTFGVAHTTIGRPSGGGYRGAALARSE